jgi:8-oxo-dGTP pyrophosphatase MutT (NUDIX family)
LDRIVVNVEVAVVREGRYLAIVRGEAEDYGAGWLGFPGGKMELELDIQDVLEQTARREVFEEVGLEIDPPIVYVESHSFGIPGETFVLDVVMLARAATGEPVCADPGEVASVHWLPFDAFMIDPRTQAWTRTSLALAETKRRDLGW